MHNFAKIALASTLLLSGANIALAQNTGVQVNTGAGTTVEAGAGGTDVNGTVGVSADANASAGAMDASGQTLDGVIASLQSSADVDLSAVTDATSVNLVLLSSLEGAANAQALDDALSSNADAQARLHANVEANAALKARIEAAGHAVDDVVAVSAQADGTVVVYIDDRA